MPKIVKKVVVVKRPAARSDGNDDDDDNSSPQQHQQQQQEIDPTTMSREELEQTVLELRRINAKLTTEVTLLRRIQLQHDRQQQQQQPSRTRSVVVVRTSARSKSAVPRQQQQRVAGPEIYAAAEELRRQGFGMTAETVAAAAAAAAHEQQQQQAQQSSAAASTSSEPLLSCSECHQQLPKSEFSSSQAKKLVGRKCKPCVVRVAEIEAQLREEAAVKAVLEKISQLPELEQLQRKVIIAEEDAAFLQAVPESPEAACSREMAFFVDAFMHSIQVPEHDDSRRPVFHEWFFSIQNIGESEGFITACSSAGFLVIRHNTAVRMLRDKGWTLVGAFQLLANYSAVVEVVAQQKLQVLVCMHLINSIIDAGALSMLPRPWRNEHNPMRQVTVLFRDIFQRLVQREDPLQLQSASMYLFGGEFFTATEFLTCVVHILQHGDTETATATQEDVIQFLKLLIDAKVAVVYCAATVDDDKQHPVATAMNNLIRFLFIAPASERDSSQSDGQSSRCFVARLLGRNDNSIPDHITEWLCVLLIRCFVVQSSTVLWFELVADLFCTADPSVVSVMLSPTPSEETAPLRRLALTVSVSKTVTIAAIFLNIDLVPRELKTQAAAHLSRAATALSSSMQKSNDPVFKERALVLVTCWLNHQNLME